MEKHNPCNHCEGKGYTEIRDCAGDIQRTERCSFCEGLGYLEIESQESTVLASWLKPQQRERPTN